MQRPREQTIGFPDCAKWFPTLSEAKEKGEMMAI
jgi:hypothetical protein